MSAMVVWTKLYAALDEPTTTQINGLEYFERELNKTIKTGTELTMAWRVLDPVPVSHIRD